MYVVDYLVRRCALLIDKQTGEQRVTYSEWSVSLKESRLIQRNSDFTMAFFFKLYVLYFIVLTTLLHDGYRMIDRMREIVEERLMGRSPISSSNDDDAS